MDVPPQTRRFIISAARVSTKWVGIAMLVWVAVVAAAIAIVYLVFHAPKAVMPVVLAFLAAYLVFLVYALTPKPMPLDASPSGVTIDGGRRGVFSPATAQLGLWNVPIYGVVAGSALHLTDGKRRFCLGGRDHRPSPLARFDAEPVITTDAYLPAAEFDAVIAAMGLPWPRPSAEPPPAVLRCALVPNRQAGPFGFGSAKAPLTLELEAAEVRVVEPTTRRLLAAAPFSEVRAVCAQHTYSGRTRYTMPVLVLEVPGLPPMHIGIPDFRFSWRGTVAKARSPELVVGGPDWLVLAQRFGGDRLVTGPG